MLHNYITLHSTQNVKFEYMFFHVETSSCISSYHLQWDCPAMCTDVYIHIASLSHFNSALSLKSCASVQA